MRERLKLSPLEKIFGAVGLFTLSAGIYRGFYSVPGSESFRGSFTNPEVYVPILIMGCLGSAKATKSEKNILLGMLAGIMTGVIFTAAGYGIGYIGR